MQIGFIGLGTMGHPMAINLQRSCGSLMVWNRTPEKCTELVMAGAAVAITARDVLRSCKTTILMLSSSDAIDEVLERDTPEFTLNVQGRIIVNMGTVAPEDSTALRHAIRVAGGEYVEAPVSGSKKPAEAGQLVAMLAGTPAAVAVIEPLLQPMCSTSVVCGDVPNALLMKFAINVYLITTVTGLAESIHFARAYGLDMEKYLSILNAGQLSSPISRVKAPKMIERDFTVQASIVDVLKNNTLISDAARQAGISSPLLDICHTLFSKTLAAGRARDDMAAVITALEQEEEPRGLSTEQGDGSRR
ncbi:NAD(P)-dependent oxidoreductase [Deinococcus sp. Arct2-2]|uniref:NAD(P)-dependent oxidoreductase n=1 Tax=Deinococcus sp. Arct2-2 TaxID=2568653 RepID=UPI0010A50067|nr:NAD(P)-dependent oxidoreductase [Deinococcus sp. Arct2-2]THF70929.1 NAD(P)-dependent oxidoreductase [Deinococcus sp. Arct2-2]